MTLIGLFSLIVRFFGFIESADALWRKHLAQKKAQDTANAPETNTEESEWFDNH